MVREVCLDDPESLDKHLAVLRALHQRIKREIRRLIYAEVGIAAPSIKTERRAQREKKLQ
jgi:hypothetical protein